ncbi:MAG: DUF1501 domain-containing protein [Planctomycetaceae bacterium]
MVAPDSRPPLPDEGVSRRDFLRFGSLGAARLTRPDGSPVDSPSASARSVILLLQTGGASQLDTWDPKPLAPAEIRGPYRPIATALPGVQFAETLPGLATRLGRCTLLRSLHHDLAPLHETSQQLLQAGRVVRRGVVPPSLGSLAAHLLGARGNMPPYVVLPRLLGPMGLAAFQGQRAGWLGSACEPWSHPADQHSLHLAPALCEALAVDHEPVPLQQQYGTGELGRACLAARRLVEAGTRFVIVNMYDQSVGRVTWDCHGSPDWAPATVYDYRHTVCPPFDRALSALLDDLGDRGLLGETLVLAAGEFGRTPRLNDKGGRDHWTGVWSALLAGGGVPAGCVIGASDTRGAIPAEDPISVPALAATVLSSLGLDPQQGLDLPGGGQVPLAEATVPEALLSLA